MPRPLVFANGRLFVGIDSRTTLRDVFWPQIGRFNHLNGAAIRTGVWHRGRFVWFDSEKWVAWSSGDARMGGFRGRLERVALNVEITDWVESEADRFVRRYQLRDEAGTGGEVRLFVAENLHLAESDIGDTALALPDNLIAHYKGPHAAAFRLFHATGEIDRFATGIAGFGNLEGAWRDAEDGELSGNPIAQGSVDAVFGCTLHIPPQGTVEVTLVMAWAETVEQAAVSAYMPAVTPQPTGVASDPIETLVARSRTFLRAFVDLEGGILAATDSDILQTNRATYAYVWPRDGALIAMVLDDEGDHNLARAYFEYAQRILPKDGAYRQKYGVDGTLGASWHPWLLPDGLLPIQEDETALTLIALAHHLHRNPDQAYLERVFEPFVRPMAEFLVRYRDDRGLPLPSYDLWEERRAVHTFTVGTVVGGLRAAANLAALLGREREVWLVTADEIEEAARRYLWDPQTGLPGRSLAEDGTLDATADASLQALVVYGWLSLEADESQRLLEHLLANLWVAQGIGGMARYPGDYYFRRHDDLPGNPWIITTLWRAQALARHATDHDELAEAEGLLQWVGQRAESTGALAEQFDARTGEPLSVSPLAWSHAEVLRTARDIKDAKLRLAQ